MKDLRAEHEHEPGVAHGGKKVNCTPGCISKMVDTAGKNIFKIHCSIFRN